MKEVSENMDEESSKQSLMRDLEQQVAACRRCPLYAASKNAVLGEGNLKAVLMLVGEAPGYQEDLIGRPFVGGAGKLLDRLLGEIEVRREEVYITNLVKHRPPNNREPAEEEIEACSPYLEEQFRIILPRVVAPLGRLSTAYVLKKFGLRPAPISKIHGKSYEASTDYGPVLVSPLYHPAVALYRKDMEEELFRDARGLKELLGRLISDQ